MEVDNSGDQQEMRSISFERKLSIVALRTTDTQHGNLKTRPDSHTQKMEQGGVSILANTGKGMQQTLKTTRNVRLRGRIANRLSFFSALLPFRSCDSIQD